MSFNQWDRSFGLSPNARPYRQGLNSQLRYILVSKIRGAVCFLNRGLAGVAHASPIHFADGGFEASDTQRFPI